MDHLCLVKIKSIFVIVIKDCDCDWDEYSNLCNNIMKHAILKY